MIPALSSAKNFSQKLTLFGRHFQRAQGATGLATGGTV